MIKPFDYYLRQKMARKAAPNISMAKSLLQKAHIRLERISRLKMENPESSIIFEDIYESLRESSQSLMELRGYKPYSHEALVSFIKENKVLTENLTNILDGYRILRNNSVYMAEHVSIEKCKEALAFAKQVLSLLQKKFDEINSKSIP